MNLKQAHTVETLMLIAKAESDRCRDAVMELEKAQTLPSEYVELTAALAAQQAASIYHVGAAICARLDIMLEIVGAIENPGTNHN